MQAAQREGERESDRHDGGRQTETCSEDEQVKHCNMSL